MNGPSGVGADQSHQRYLWTALHRLRAMQRQMAADSRFFFAQIAFQNLPPAGRVTDPWTDSRLRLMPPSRGFELRIEVAFYLDDIVIYVGIVDAGLRFRIWISL